MRNEAIRSRTLRRLAPKLVPLVCSLSLAGCAYVPGTASPYQQYRQRLAEQRSLDRAAEAAAAEQPEKKQPTLAEKLEEGDRAKQRGDLPRAMLAYLQAYQLDPSDPRSRERIAYLHLAKDPQRAELLFSELAEEIPGSANVRLGLGLSQLSQGRLADARTTLEKAVLLDPTSAVAHYSLSVVYEMLGDPETAYAHADRARALDPRDASIVGNLGLSQMLRGNYEEAERSLRRAMLLDPQTPAHHNNLGLTLGMLKRYDEALEEFRAGGSEQSAQNNLGYVYFLNGENQTAIEHYELALLAEGDDDEAILANLHRVLDQIDRAEPAKPAEPTAIRESAVVVVAPTAVGEQLVEIEAPAIADIAEAPAALEAAPSAARNERRRPDAVDDGTAAMTQEGTD